MFLFLFSKLLENRTSAEILRDACGARVELEAAAFRSNRDSKRIAGENQLGGPVLRRRLARLARLACTVDLDDALLARELPRRGDLFNERFDVRAQKLE